MNWFTLIFCFVIGIAAVYYSIKSIKLRNMVRKWQKVPAKILSQKVIPKRTSGATRANFALSIEYAYSFNRKEYKNDKVFLIELIKGERAFYKDDAEKFLSKLPGDTHVFVDPNDPSRSVMFCDGMWLYVLMLVIGIITTLVVILSFAA